VRVHETTQLIRGDEDSTAHSHVIELALGDEHIDSAFGDPKLVSDCRDSKERGESSCLRRVHAPLFATSSIAVKGGKFANVD